MQTGTNDLLFKRSLLQNNGFYKSRQAVPYQRTSNVYGLSFFPFVRNFDTGLKLGLNLTTLLRKLYPRNILENTHLVNIMFTFSLTLQALSK